jgi:hypothetical protein
MNRVYLSMFVVLWTIELFSARSIANEAEQQWSPPDEDSRRLLDEFRTTYALSDDEVVKRPKILEQRPLPSLSDRSPTFAGLARSYRPLPLSAGILRQSGMCPWPHVS